MQLNMKMVSQSDIFNLKLERAKYIAPFHREVLQVLPYVTARIPVLTRTLVSC